MKCNKCKKSIPKESEFCLYCGHKQTPSNTPRKERSRGNGTGTVYKRGSGWEAQVTVGFKINPKTGKKTAIKRSKGAFRTKKEALDHIPILQNPNYETQPTATTIQNLWDNYSNNQMLDLSKSKQAHYKTAYKRLDSIAYVPISSLTIDNLQSLVDRVTHTFYPARETKDLLSHLYNRAVAQGNVTTNLAPFIRLPELKEREVEPFTNDELLELWNDYGNGYNFTGYILLMIYSGMMPGELFQTEKHMIDWDNNCIIGSGLKTKRRKETPIVIADFIIPVLKDLYQRSTSLMLLDVNKDDFYKEFKTAMRRCGVKNKVPYDCRHTTATALSLAGVEPAAIQAVMRHTKFDTTERYIHIDVDVTPLRSAVNRITQGLEQK